MGGNRVQLQTVKSWNLPDIAYETETTEQGKEVVISIWCVLCARYKPDIVKDDRIRGVAVRELDKYAVGTSYVSKYTVLRHLKSIAHTIALEKNKSAVDKAYFPKTDANQPRIDTAIDKASRKAYAKLIKSAYLLAVDGAPLTFFRTIVRCQKSSGVQLIDKTDSADSCALFIHQIASVIREKLKEILTEATCASCLTDGSQARKTGAEKELVYVRVVREGKPLFYLVSLADIDQFGDSDAATLKQAIDHSFTNSIGLPHEKYVSLLTASTSDGASVNTGIYNGLLVRMKEDRPWLITIHCVSHRLELAIKDSLKRERSFTTITDFMVSIFYTLKQSGKLKRQLKQTAHDLGVQVYNHPKVHGTRFISHQLRGVKVLLNNWIPLAQGIENILASNAANPSMKPKLEGYLKKLRDYRFLRLTESYMEYLTTLAKMSLKFEADSLLVHEVKPSVEKTTCLLEDLKFETKFVPEDNTISSTLIKEGHMKRKPGNREYITLSLDGINNINNSDVTEVTGRVTSELIKCLGERFKSFSNSLFQKMSWIDPANWSPSLNAELPDIEFVAIHFREQLVKHNFDREKVKSEWKQLKITHKHFYAKSKVRPFWEKIFQYRRSEFVNLCLLAEVILSLSVSNAVVERGFSHLTHMLNDKRLSMNHKTMEDLLLIRVNDLSWSPAEKDDLIERALDLHLSKRRKRKLDNKPFNLFNRKRKHSDSDDSDVETIDSDVSPSLLDDELMSYTNDEENAIYFFSDSENETDFEGFTELDL